jgi:hypothetical protein
MKKGLKRLAFSASQPLGWFCSGGPSLGLIGDMIKSVLTLHSYALIQPLRNRRLVFISIHLRAKNG